MPIVIAKAQPYNGRAVLAVTVAAMFAILQAGCSTSPASQAEGKTPVVTTSEGGAKPNLNPLRIAIIQDKSLSTGETRTPQLKLEDMDPLVQLLGQTGGELAVGVIHDRSYLTFARVRIDVGPEEPVAPAKADNPLDRPKQSAGFRKRTEEFQTEQQTWLDEMQARIGEFQQSVSPILSMAANAKHSPVWDAVQRAELFLAETDSRSLVTHRYTVLITDGLDDVGARPVPVHSGTRILMVNGAGQMGSLAVLNPQRFESIEAAVRYIVGTETK